VPDDSSDEPKRVAHGCIILKCSAWLHPSFAAKHSSTHRD